jgi:predicted nuclease of restriction endonuclease-like (RecB) superfamily
MTIKTSSFPPKVSTSVTLPEGLLDDLRKMISQAKQTVAVTINASITMLYWQVGLRIRTEILKNERAEYGQKIVVTLSQQLTMEYGKGFSKKSLHRMIQFGEVYPDEQIVAALLRQLSWTHFTILIPIKDSIKRDFYTEMCRIERWNYRTLQKKINSMLFERTALSKKPDYLIRAEVDALRKEDLLTPDIVFRDPYVLEFLDLNDHYIEKDLEDAIMRELEQFLLELGTGFTFLARQKRIIIDEEDFKIDLLFFHRDLKRLVVIELKLGSFKAEYKGQMELYLRWLDKNERRPYEESPVGLILCTGDTKKKQEQIELLELHQSGIHVAEYLTALPPKEMLREKLLRAIEAAQKRLQFKDMEKDE